LYGPDGEINKEVLCIKSGSDLRRLCVENVQFSSSLAVVPCMRGDSDTPLLTTRVTTHTPPFRSTEVSHARRPVRQPQSPCGLLHSQDFRITLTKTLLSLTLQNHSVSVSYLYSVIIQW